MKVAVLSLGWPPVWGGGEVYPHRLVEALRENKIDAWGITATPEVADKDNGSECVKRIVTPEIEKLVKEHESGIKIISCLVEKEYDDLRLEWLQEVEKTIENEGFDVGIVITQFIPLKKGDLYQEIVERMFPVMISISYDYDLNHLQELEEDFKQTKSWKKTLDYFSSQRDNKNSEGLSLKDELMQKTLTANHGVESDGKIHITKFNQQLSECFFGEHKSIVFHPCLDETWWSSKKNTHNDKFTVGYINLSTIKGVQHLMKLMRFNPDFHFKILAGGWGSGKALLEYYLDVAKRFYGVTIDNYEICDYIKDIKQYYDELDAFLFPSMFEGYGQVAAEAMARGVPIIAKRYPAICEATCNHANYVEIEDYQDIEVWNKGLHDIKDNYDYWLKQTEQGAKLLKERQDQEILDLKLFLEQFVLED